MLGEPKFSVVVKPNYLDRYWSNDYIDYAHYTRYVRDAWLEYVRHLGLEWPRDRVLMVIREEHNYLSPCMIEEELRIYSQQTKIGRSSGTMEFQINEAGAGRPIALFREIVVWVDRETGQSVSYPEEWRKAILNFEGRENIEVAAG